MLDLSEKNGIVKKKNNTRVSELKRIISMLLSHGANLTPR